LLASHGVGWAFNLWRTHADITLSTWSYRYTRCGAGLLTLIVGGHWVSGGGGGLVGAGAGGPFIITDVVLTQLNCSASTSYSVVTIETAEGDVLAKYVLAADSDGDGSADDAGSAGAVVAHAYTTGVAVASGTGAYITKPSGCSVYFSISGYQAHG
jgi:hypothetical protein